MIEPTPANLQRQTTRLGPLVDHELLREFLQPYIARHGVDHLALRADVHPDSIRHMINGTNRRARVRLDFADKLLTRGLGRPDLVALVCPVVESDAGEASSRRGLTPRGRDETK